MKEGGLPYINFCHRLRLELENAFDDLVPTLAGIDVRLNGVELNDDEVWIDFRVRFDFRLSLSPEILLKESPAPPEAPQGSPKGKAQRGGDAQC